MAYIFLTLSIIVFIGLIKLLRIEPMVRSAATTAREAGAVMASRTLDDDAKEAAIQAASLKMLGFLGKITCVSVVAVGVSIGVAASGVWAGFLELDRLISASVDWRFLVGATVVTLSGLWITR
ncbi:MAG: hypothetical protein AAF950_02485 [Pseudomonadota bacterium]